MYLPVPILEIIFYDKSQIYKWLKISELKFGMASNLFIYLPNS